MVPKRATNPIEFPYLISRSMIRGDMELQLLVAAVLVLLSVAMLPITLCQQTAAALVLDPFTMAQGQAPAVVLGPYQMTPWNITFFNDTNAKWIWSRKSANTGAPTDLYAVCWKTLSVTTSTVATLFAAVDDTATVLVNSKVVAVLADGMQPGNPVRVDLTLDAGANMVQFQCQNFGGAAGFIATLYINRPGNPILARSDASWKCMEMAVPPPPASPPRPPSPRPPSPPQPPSPRPPSPRPPSPRPPFPGPRQLSGERPAVTLGPYNMAPWNLASFTDTSAKWIWSRDRGHEGSASNIYSTCWTTVVVATTNTMRIVIAVDDEADISVNGKYTGTVIGWQYLRNSLPDQRLNAGPNLIQLQARNMRGGPGGMLVSILSGTGNKLARSDSATWTCTEAYINSISPPSPPSPSPSPPPLPPPSPPPTPRPSPPPLPPPSPRPSPPPLPPPSPPPSPRPSPPPLPPPSPPPSPRHSPPPLPPPSTLPSPPPPPPPSPPPPPLLPSVPPLQPVAPSYVVHMFSGGEDTVCAVVAPAYKIKCWGANRFGELGGTSSDQQVLEPSSLPYINLGSNVGGVINVTTFTSTSRHFCVKLAGGFKCWGANEYGQLGLQPGKTGESVSHTDEDEYHGLGDKLPFIDIGPDVNMSDVVVGPVTGHTTCMHVLSKGKIKCWGMGIDGQLGYEDNGQRNYSRDLPYVDVGPGQSISSLAGGAYCTCAVLQPSGGIKCWGYMAYNDSVTSWRFFPSKLPFISLGINLTASAVVMGAWHACALLQPGGRVKCWGGNKYGSLGYVLVDSRGADGDPMGDTLPFVDLGSNVTVTALVAGPYHNCALLSPGNRVKCWGANNGGQLGLNDTRDRGFEVGSMGDNLPFVELGTGLQVTGLTASLYRTCAVLQPGGTVKCWGGAWNYPGRHGDDPNEMGDNLPFVNLGF